MTSRQHQLLLVAKLLLTLVIFSLLYHYSQLKFSLLSTFLYHPLQTALIILLCYLMVLFHAWRWHRLNSAQHIELPFSQTVLPAFIGIAYNNVLPGSIGGDFYRLYFVLKKFPTKKSNAVLAILVDRITGLLGIFIIASISATFYLGTLKMHTSLLNLYFICTAVCVSCIALAFAIFYLFSGKVEYTQKVRGLLSKTRFAKPLVAMFDAVMLYRHSKMILLESIFMSIGTQFLLLIVVWQISVVMGLPVLSAGIYLIALLIAQVANMVPLTPGGLGVGEAAFGNIIYLLVPGMTAYATVFFALRLLSTLAYLPGVLLGAYRFHLPQAELNAAN